MIHNKPSLRINNRFFKQEICDYQPKIENKSYSQKMRKKRGICQLKTHDYNPYIGINILDNPKYKNIIFDRKIKEINNENVILVVYDQHESDVCKRIAFEDKIIEFLPNFKNIKELFLVDGDRDLLFNLAKKIMKNNNTLYDINIIKDYDNLGLFHQKIEKGTCIDNFDTLSFKCTSYEYEIFEYVNDNYFEESIDITKE